MSRFELSDERGNEMVEGLQVRITRISDGLGFGSGTISGHPEGMPPEVLNRVDQTIEQSPNILVAVDKDDNGNLLDDDGCGDGRGVRTIFKGAELYKRSLNRAKVFGGGLVMAVSSRIGLGSARGKLLNEVYHDAQGELAEKHIDYGAHTDTHANGENCGCGAIDKCPLAVENAVTYETPIRATIAALGVSDNGLDEVYQEFKSYANENSGRSYSGRKVMEGIIGNGKVVKQLDGEHKEARIVLNLVEGMTVNQQLIRDVSDNQAQIFATDVWRLQQIAKRLHPTDAAAEQKAFISELVYTLGVAATLTPGDLPVYVVTTAPIGVAV